VAFQLSLTVRSVCDLWKLVAERTKSGGDGSTKYLEDGMGLWGDRPLGNEGSTARIEDRRRPLGRSNQHKGMVASWLTGLAG
jgi:hypothetical protein